MTKETTDKTPQFISKYSAWSSILGLNAYLFFFPNGMYYGFVLGMLGFAGGVLSKKNSVKGFSSGIAIVVGFIDIILCCISFYGFYIVFSSVSDPTLGPQINSMFIELFQSYGISPESLVKLMHP